MSVVSKNPFAILDDDAGVTPEPASTKPAAPTPAPPSRTAQQKPKTGPASRGGKYYNRGGKPARDSAPAGEDAPEKEKKADTREGGRGRGRGRGRGDGARGRGRQFDKHSATGKTDSDKKIHQSWGGDDGNAELKVEEAANTDANNDWANEGAVGADWAAPPVEGAADATDKPEGRPRREREPEEEDNTLTLDQYLAQQKNKETIVPKLEARQANDGAGDDIWKGATVLAKDEDEEVYFAGKAKAAPKARAKKEDKVYIEIDGRFDRPERGGRGRGGRGGDRGRGAPRAAPRGGRGGRQNGASTVNVDDQTAFPSLS